jgi:hypothetical protein
LAMVTPSMIVSSSGWVNQHEPSGRLGHRIRSHGPTLCVKDDGWSGQLRLPIKDYARLSEVTSGKVCGLAAGRR